MFTKLLKEESGKNINKSIQPNNDCVVEDQSNKNDQDNHNEITDDFIYQINSSSLDPTSNVPLNDLATREHDDNEQISTLHDYDLGTDIEGELLRILSSLFEEEGEKIITIRNHP